MVQELLLDLARLYLKDSVEGLVGQDHAKLFVQDEQGFAHRFHDAVGKAARSLDDLLSLLVRGDIQKCHHEAVDGIFGGPIGKDPHGKPDPIDGLDFPLLDDECLKHILCILQQPLRAQLRHDVRQGASDIAGDQMAHPLRL